MRLDAYRSTACAILSHRFGSLGRQLWAVKGALPACRQLEPSSGSCTAIGCSWLDGSCAGSAASGLPWSHSNILFRPSAGNPARCEDSVLWGNRFSPSTFCASSSCSHPCASFAFPCIPAKTHLMAFQNELMPMCNYVCTIAPGISDAQSETAWRLGAWREPHLQAAQATVLSAATRTGCRSSGRGFHQALCACLRALDSGDHTAWAATLSDARQVSAANQRVAFYVGTRTLFTYSVRLKTCTVAVRMRNRVICIICFEKPLMAVQDIVRSLGVLNPESSASVGPGIVQLQMLQSLSEAWLLRWPLDPLAGSAATPDSAGHAPTVPSQDLLASAQEIWRQREVVTGMQMG